MAEVSKISLEQRFYLKEKGLNIINGAPSSEEPRPYMSLRELQPFLESTDISYHHVKGNLTGMMGVHPVYQPTDFLVATIERLACEEYGVDSHPRSPLKIFVMDSAWNEVAEKLRNTYQKKVK